MSTLAIDATRVATADDIAARLTGIDARRYRMTSEAALGWGMGDAQYGIPEGLTAAIEQGRVEVVEVRHSVRFVRATEKALTEDRSGIACAPNARDNYCHIHNHFAPAVEAPAVEPDAALVITGRAARDIDQHVRVYVRPGNWWSEVQGMRECKHGCKLHVRQRGAVRQYALIHSGSYGCVLGKNEATRTVPVSVRPSAQIA